MKKLSCCLFLICCVNIFASNQLLDKIVAVVGEDMIMYSDLQKATNNIKNDIIMKKEPIPDNLETQVLEHLIDEKVQLQTAKLQKITVSDKEIDQVITNILKTQKISLEKLKQNLSQHGKTLAQFKQSLTNQLTIEKLQNSVVAEKVQVSDTDIKSFIKNYKLQNKKVHIVDWLLEVTKDDQWNKVNALAKTLHKQLLANKNVSVAAIRTDLGWSFVNDLPDVFIKDVQQSKAKDVNRPIKAPNGMHVLQVIEVKVPDIDKSQAYKILYNKLANKEITKWLNNLRKNHAVIIMSDE